MSLRKLLAIGKKFGCEQEIRDWMVSSVVSFGSSKIIDTTAPYYDDFLKERVKEYAKKEIAHELGRAIMESPAARKEIHEVRMESKPSAYRDMLMYRVLVIKADTSGGMEGQEIEHTSADPEQASLEQAQLKNVADADSM